MVELIRTDATNPDFIQLVAKLDADLAISDGDQHDFYNQYNSIADIKHVILIYQGDLPVSCGAMKSFDETTMEIKRMFTEPAHRGRGLASTVLQGLENWATELGYTKCILETGLKQPAAIQLYYRNGYKLIPNYGQYAGVENSRCFEKVL